jgi:hypothetical protein
MKVEIKDRWTERVILCGEYESIRECLEKNKTANLSKADLSKADLSWANLSGADGLKIIKEGWSQPETLIR